MRSSRRRSDADNIYLYYNIKKEDEINSVTKSVAAGIKI